MSFKCSLIFVFCTTLSLTGCFAQPTLDSKTADSSNVQSSLPKYETYIKVGQQLPVTTFNTIDGKTVDFNQINTRKLVILFATWCSDSQRAMKALHESEIINQKSLQIIAIARENTREQVEQFKQERNITIDLVADIDRSIYMQFASAGIPRFIMVDENNLIIGEALAEGDYQMELISWN